MTIKEVERTLQIPRATIRFYEKEGLITPQRSENGYREYSDEDVERLKKIIILRKLGISLTDIEDILDGARQMTEVISNHIVYLEQQIDELSGAITVCHKIHNNEEEIATFDVNKYWNVIEEEEKRGQRFIDIARDVAHLEKATILSYFGLADYNGNLNTSLKGAIGSVLGLLITSGLVTCLLRGAWNMKNFWYGVYGIFWIIFVECILSAPLYFIGKKHPWVAKHRVAILIAICLVIILLLLLLSVFIA